MYSFFALDQNRTKKKKGRGGLRPPTTARVEGGGPGGEGGGGVGLAGTRPPLVFFFFFVRRSRSLTLPAAPLPSRPPPPCPTPARHTPGVDRRQARAPVPPPSLSHDVEPRLPAWVDRPAAGKRESTGQEGGLPLPPACGRAQAACAWGANWGRRRAGGLAAGGALFFFGGERRASGRCCRGGALPPPPVPPRIPPPRGHTVAPRAQPCTHAPPSSFPPFTARRRARRVGRRRPAAPQVLRAHLQDGAAADAHHQRERERGRGRGSGREWRGRGETGPRARRRPDVGASIHPTLTLSVHPPHPAQIGKVQVGSEHPIRIQTMTTTGEREERERGRRGGAARSPR